VIHDGHDVREALAVSRARGEHVVVPAPGDADRLLLVARFERILRDMIEGLKSQGID
jgi:hypothetical protein